MTSLGPTGRGLSQPNFFGAGWRMGLLPAPPVPQAFMLNYPGSIAPNTASPWARFLRGAQTRDVAQASRLASSLRMSVPLTGIGPTEIPVSNHPYFVPEPTGTAFHEFLGLKPTEVRQPSELPVPEDGWIGLLERENAEVLDRKRDRALEEFKSATGAVVEDRAERLSKAQWALRVVRDLDREAHIPCLLLIHIALEKQQSRVAITHLADVVRRRPALFVERPDLASYFGDPKLLERTARDYLKIGDESPSPANYALQAYCAWILDDRARVNDALDKMLAEDLSGEMTGGISAVRDALAAAVK